MELGKLNDQEMDQKIMQACIQDDEYMKDMLVTASEQDPRIAALVFNHLYDLVDYDLNFVIDVMAHSSERERNTILREAQDLTGMKAIFDEYSREELGQLEVEDIVEGRDLDIIWEVKEGSREGELSRAYLQRCLMTIAYHLGFQQEMKAFFEEQKNNYLVLH